MNSLLLAHQNTLLLKFSEIWARFSTELTVLGMSMVPVLELRGSIIYGVAHGLNPIENFIFAVIGNLIPIPIILIFFRYVLHWMLNCNINFINKSANFIERKLRKGGKKVEKYKLLGLFILVAIPLPGTGGWTGAGVAVILDIPLRKSFPVIALGVIAAGIVMCLASYGTVGFLDIFK